MKLSRFSGIQQPTGRVYKPIYIPPPAAPQSQAAYTTAGTYTWTVPTGVTSICVVCIGAGASGKSGQNGNTGVDGNVTLGGGGGGLGYVNTITVTPGATYTVSVGAGGTGSINDGGGGAGGDTYFKPTIGANIVIGYGGGFNTASTWPNNQNASPGGTYFASIGYGTYGGGNGGVGAVRIIWGTGRSFPSTNTNDV